MTLHARKITLRTCGRFSVVASDFGADYRTHTHVTGEAMYASLTRGETWHPRLIVIKEDTYDFARDYDLAEMPIWFTPGLFLGSNGTQSLPAHDLDSTFFNSVHEFYPSTSGGYSFQSATRELKPSSRPGHVPTYGIWQSVLPDRRLTTYGLSRDAHFLDRFELGQTYLLGKKRAMVQIADLSTVAVGQEQVGTCQTPFIQLPPDGAAYFESFEVASVTMRYIIVRGLTREAGNYWEFIWDSGERVSLPAFYLENVLPQQ